MSKSIDYIESESFVVVNPDYPVISKENALIAVEMAEREIKQKAIIAACNFCINSGGGCGHIDRNTDHCFQCDQLTEFINEFNEE
ncbi:MAG: hypothetical protein GY706_05260 [Bacteroides sp.]|nr:hypothetical protein [Bacteroides sp.]